MAAVLPELRVAGYRPHALHDPARHWAETNCYVDLWIELLNALGCAPEAALGFAAGLDFEGDQFTFFKFPQADLEALYGLRALELAVYDSLEIQVMEQIRRGRFVLVEVDGFYLPDTQGVSYRLEHTKTTIGINMFNPGKSRMSYFHNAGYFLVEGADFDALLRRVPAMQADADLLFPYAEFVKDSGARLSLQRLRQTARALTRVHVERRPQVNPLLVFRDCLDAQGDALAAKPPAFFHKYAFNTLRQLGASFELFGTHLSWLNGENDARLILAAQCCDSIAASSKSLQFQMARAFARKKTTGLSKPLDAMSEVYARIFGLLDAVFGS